MRADIFWNIVLVVILAMFVVLTLAIIKGDVYGIIVAILLVLLIAFIWIGVSHGWHYY